jgi:hypothetical protein
MSKSSGNIRIIRGLAVAAAIMVACPASAEDAICRGATPPLDDDHAKNLVLLLGHVTSLIPPVMGSERQQGCPSRAPDCAKTDFLGYLESGHSVILSGRHDAFVCATYLNFRGVDHSDWLSAEAVAVDKAGPVALADWLGHWRHNTNAVDGRTYHEGDITVKAGNAGALQIEGAANHWYKGMEEARPAAIKSDVTPAADRLSFTSQGSDCKVQMQRLGSWLIVRDDQFCGGGGDFENATFDGIYTRTPLVGTDEAAAPAGGVTPIGYLKATGTGHGPCIDNYISLWRTAETVVGRFFCISRGYQSDLIKQVSYDQKTGHLTFTARLLFNETDPAHVFTFDGLVAAAEVTGTLKHVDESDPQRGATSERIRFRKPKEEEGPVMGLKSYRSPAAWNADQSEPRGNQ